MNARWRFRLIGADRKGIYLIRDGKPLEVAGTDEEALALAWDLAEPVAMEGSLVQAISVGCPAGIAREGPGRLLALVRARRDRLGWTLEGDMMSATWHRSLVEAVNYSSFRTVGYTSEIRILDVRGAVTHVVLVSGGKRRLTLY